MQLQDEVPKHDNIVYVALIALSIYSLYTVFTYSLIDTKATYTMRFINKPEALNATQNLYFSVSLRTDASIPVNFTTLVLIDGIIVESDSKTIGPQSENTLQFSLANPGVGKHRVLLKVFDPLRDYDSYSSRARPYELYFNVDVK